MTPKPKPETWQAARAKVEREREMRPAPEVWWRCTRCSRTVHNHSTEGVRELASVKCFRGKNQECDFVRVPEVKRPAQWKCVHCGGEKIGERRRACPREVVAPGGKRKGCVYERTEKGSP